MVVDCVPNCVRDIANGSKDICDERFSYQAFVTLLAALFFGVSSFSAIARVFVFSQSVSSLSRYASHVPHEALLRRCRNRVANLLRESEFPERRFVLITDDTLVRKFGATIDNCYWFDHCSGASMKGRNYLVLIVLDTFTGQSYPVSVVLLKGTKHKDYVPRIEVLKQQLLILKEAGLGQISLCADSWFADSKLFEWLSDNGFDFEIEIKSNRKITYLDKHSVGVFGEKGKIVYPSICDVACSCKRNTAFSGGAPKLVASGVVRLFGSGLRLRFAAVWNKNELRKDRPFAIYVTNRTSRCASRIWALSRFRWAIECHFRLSKQDFSFDAFPTHSSKTALGLIALGMFLLCTLELSRHDPWAMPMGKAEQKKKYVPLSTWVKEIRAQTEDFVLRRAMFRSDKRRSLQEHLHGRKNARSACSKPRDKHTIKNVSGNEGNVRLDAA